MDMVVTADAAALADAAAQWIVDEIAPATGPVALCLSGGSTPERLYRRLAEPPFRDRIPWQRTHWFFGDERFVPRSDTRSNARMARLALFDHVPVPPAQIHPIPILADPEASARAYEAELKAFHGSDGLDPDRPLFDVVLCGLGPDGHTASLFPGAPALDETARWVVPVAQAGQPPYVPRVTLTLPALNAGRSAAFLVGGTEKAAVLRAIRSGTDLPAARVRALGRLVWFADRAAAGEGP